MKYSCNADDGKSGEDMPATSASDGKGDEDTVNIYY